MKALPALPSVSAHEVARLGAASVAEAAMPRAITSMPMVSLPLGRVVSDGVLKLRNEATGQICGIFASEAVAERTINFFR